MTAPDVCDRCTYPVIQVDGEWVHASNGDAVMCQMRQWADKARAAQEAINDLGAGKPEATS